MLSSLNCCHGYREQGPRQSPARQLRTRETLPQGHAPHGQTAPSRWHTGPSGRADAGGDRVRNCGGAESRHRRYSQAVPSLPLPPSPKQNVTMAGSHGLFQPCSQAAGKETAVFSPRPQSGSSWPLAGWVRPKHALAPPVRPWLITQGTSCVFRA